MPNEQLVMTLGKVLIATAWVDGEVSWTEINCLKDLLFKMTALTGRDWARLQIYVETPVSPQERARLLSDLKQAISSPDDQATALSVLEDVCQADGILTEDERVVFGEIKQTIAEAQTGLFGSMSKLLRSALVRRSDALANAPNREQHFEEFIRRKIYYKLSRRLEMDETDIEITDEDLRKLCAAGGLMARIAHADNEIADEEFKVICEALQNGWGVSRQQAALTAEIAISEVGAGLDLHRTTRAFFNSTDHEERSRFLDVLFAVAEAHGGKSHDEIEDVRKIARMLRVSHRDFIRAKLKDSSG